MAEMVAGAFLSSFLDVLFDRMASRNFISFFETPEMDIGMLKKLKSLLNTVGGVLDDAENRQFSSKFIKSWLDELRDAAYNADDLLGEFHYEYTRSRVRAKQQSIDAPEKVIFSGTQLDRMKEIVRRLEYLVEQSGTLRLKEDVKKYASSERVSTTSAVEESSVFGRDGDKEEIFKLLLPDDLERSSTGVIPIVGMGGIGKTTLAQLVYNDNRAKQFFQIRAWVCVSENYDGFTIKREILKHINKSGAYDHLTPNLIDEELGESLKGKKYLFVFDDMWNANYADWDKFLTPLKSAACGSKIIVTTRNQRVASTVCVHPTYYELGKLPDEYCWQLFVKHAFDGVNADQTLEDIGKKIVSKCQGLPLAAKMLGRLLRHKRESKWKEILKNNIWDLPMDDNILPALRLSYQHLPSHLKQCFSYLAIFPKGFDMTKEEIVRLWMAEGFLPQNGGVKEAEELGERCLDELVSRSFLQKVSYEGDDRTFFCMHDLIDDLAQHISGEFLVRMERDNSCKISERNRHFSNLAGQIESSKIFDSSRIFDVISKAPALRTILTLPWHNYRAQKKIVDLLDQIVKLVCLRVLSLRGFRAIDKLPDSLDNLKLLRYLNLAETSLKSLPESVCTLFNLQILILYGCTELVKLPNNMGNLISLYCLDIRETPNLQEMPSGMGNLKELRTLGKFCVGGQSGRKINELENLQHLQELYIVNLQNVENVPINILKNRENLQELILEWNGETLDSSRELVVLYELQPSISIKKLSIYGYGSTSFPNWVGDASYTNIVCLKLEGCKYFSTLPTLGELPFLEDLSIKKFEKVRNVGADFCKSSNASMKMPFSSLKTLRIGAMIQWETWVIHEENDSINCKSFAKLEELTIFDCPMLNSILTYEPTHKIFKSLNKLYIEDCPNLKTSNLLAISNFKIFEMKGKGRQLSLKQMPSAMYSVNVGSYTCSKREECNPRMEGNEEMLFLFNALEIEEIEISDNDLLQFIALEVLPKLHLRVFSCNELISLSAFEESLNQLSTASEESLNQMSTASEESLNQLSTLLASLEMKRCHSFASFPNGGIIAPNLTRLILEECSNLTSLPQSMHDLLSSLEHLRIAFCNELLSFPKGGLPANLQSLEIYCCKNLIDGRSQWDLQKLSALSHFSLGGYNGDDLDSFPEETLLPSSLKSVEFRGLFKLKIFNYQGLQHLISLSALKFDDCPEIDSFPEGGLPSNLQSLEIIGCDMLIRGRLQWGLQRLHALSRLCLMSYYGDDLDSFPEQTLLPSTLSSLQIKSFSKIKCVNYDGLRHLTSLAELKISDCPNLQYLPEEELRSSFPFLTLQLDYPVLKGEKNPKIDLLGDIDVPSFSILEPESLSAFEEAVSSSLW